MIFLRFLLVAFNVAVVGFLVYTLLEIAKRPVPKFTKAIVITAGIMLLLAPFGIFFGIFPASIQYFMVYPVAIGLFLYLTRQLAIR